MTDVNDKPMTCPGHCPTCSSNQKACAEPGLMTGWRLALSAACSFLLPLALAVAGAIALGPDATRETAGAFAGLAAGIVAAVVVHRIAGRGKAAARDEAHADLNPGR
jgi:hypothetical protein